MVRKKQVSGLPRRIGAGAIDLLLFSFVGFFYVDAAVIYRTNVGYELPLQPLILFMIVILLYYIFTEAIWGKTLGKYFFGIKVVNSKSKKITFWESCSRNFLRIIDSLPFLYLVGLVSVYSTKKNQRVGDIITNTYVILENKKKH